MRQRITALLTVNSPDEDERQRGLILMLIALGLIVTALLLLPLTAREGAAITGTITIVGTAVLSAGVFALARTGRVTLGAVVIVGLIVIGTIGSMYSSGSVSIAIFYLPLASLIASLTLRPRHVWLVMIAGLVGLAILLGRLPENWLSDQTMRTTAIAGVVFLGIVSLISYLGASVMAGAMRNVRRARTQIEASAADLARSNVDLEQRIAERTGSLQSALSEVRTRAEEQARLLAEVEQQRTVIREMSIPAIPISDTTTIIPLIGALDSARLTQLSTQALQSIERSGARFLILDITGVIIVDSHVAQGIVAVVQSARLLGSEVILVGIRPEVAQAVVQLQLDLAGIRTYSTLQAALKSIDVNSRAW